MEGERESELNAFLPERLSISVAVSPLLYSTIQNQIGVSCRFPNDHLIASTFNTDIMMFNVRGQSALGHAERRDQKQPRKSRFMYQNMIDKIQSDKAPLRH